MNTITFARKFARLETEHNYVIDRLFRIGQWKI